MTDVDTRFMAWCAEDDRGSGWKNRALRVAWWPAFLVGVLMWDARWLLASCGVALVGVGYNAWRLLVLLWWWAQLKKAGLL